MSEKLGAASIAAVALSAYIFLIGLILFIKHITRNECCEGGCCEGGCCSGVSPIDSCLLCLGESCDCTYPSNKQLADTLCPTQQQCHECCGGCLPDTACNGDITCCCFEIRLAG